MRSLKILPSFLLLTLLTSACRESRSYVVLVTATPVVISGENAVSPAPIDVGDKGSVIPSPTFIPTPNVTRAAVVDVSQDQIYGVQPGDTLSLIALRFGVTVESILAANGISDSNELNVGQQLIIPTAIQVTGPRFKIIPD